MLISTPPCGGGLSSYRRTDGQTATGWNTPPYRTKILVLHLLELGIGIAGAQFHVPQNHLEHGVVDGLGEVHVQLVHSSLRRQPKSQKPFRGTKLCRCGSAKWWQQRNGASCFLKAINLFIMFQIELYLFHMRAWRKMKNVGFKRKRKWDFSVLYLRFKPWKSPQFAIQWLMKKEQQGGSSSNVWSGFPQLSCGTTARGNVPTADRSIKLDKSNGCTQGGSCSEERGEHFLVTYEFRK